MAVLVRIAVGGGVATCRAAARVCWADVGVVKAAVAVATKVVARAVTKVAIIKLVKLVRRFFMEKRYLGGESWQFF
jgi:hypothetical protein